MQAHSNQHQKLRVTVSYGLERSVTRVKSYGSLRGVYIPRNSVTTPELAGNRYGVLGRMEKEGLDGR